MSSQDTDQVIPWHRVTPEGEGHATVMPVGGALRSSQHPSWSGFWFVYEYLDTDGKCRLVPLQSKAAPGPDGVPSL